jgi:hypothetical protein
MDEMRHFNSFCELFQRLEAICKSGGKGSNEATKVIGVMQFHFRSLTYLMYKYLDKFTGRLMELGYIFAEAPSIPINEEDIAKEAKVAGKFDYATLVHDRKPGEVAHVGQKAGAVFNYNEFSKTLGKLTKEEFENIKKKTLENFKFEAACFENPELKLKMQAKYRQPKKWALADSEKDW